GRERSGQGREYLEGSRTRAASGHGRQSGDALRGLVARFRSEHSVEFGSKRMGEGFRSQQYDVARSGPLETRMEVIARICFGASRFSCRKYVLGDAVSVANR